MVTRELRPCGTWAAYARGCRCDECRATARAVKHAQRHGVRPLVHPCPHCDRTFAGLNGLSVHTAKAHRPEHRARPDHIARLYAEGLGLPLRRADGETLPCTGHTDVMFPARTGHQGDVAVAVGLAQALCDTCHRRSECAELADMRREPDGIYGGLDMFIRYGLTSRARRARLAG